MAWTSDRMSLLLSRFGFCALGSGAALEVSSPLDICDYSPGKALAEKIALLMFDPRIYRKPCVRMYAHLLLISLFASLSGPAGR